MGIPPAHNMNGPCRHTYTGATQTPDEEDGPTGEQPASGRLDKNLFDIETTGARPARVLDYLAGGDGHFAADRKAADYLSAVLPDGIDTARANVRAMAVFMERAVRHLVDTAGIRQFLDVGAPVPTARTVHEVAQEAAPDARVVYVGSDPVVLARAHELRTSSPEGATAYVHATLRDPDMILERAAATLDLTRPIAVLLLATLSFVPDDREPYRLVAQLLAGLAPGSYLAIAHTTNDIPAEGMADAAERLSEALRDPYVVRGHTEISRFFDGLVLLDPGLVQVDQWHGPDDPQGPGEGRLIPIYAGLGRKP